MSKRAVLLADAPWHNGNNNLISGEDLERLMRMKTRPTGQRLQDYRKAFVHTSYIIDGDRKNPSSLRHCEAIIPLQVHSNERLEFLGDAVIDLIVAEYLYERYPDEDEGFLTQMRIGLVNGKMLANLGRSISIQRFLLLSYQNEHLRDTDNLVEDTLEAFVGAMYTERGMKGTKEWFVLLIEDYVDFTKMVTTSERDMFARLYRERFGYDVDVMVTRKDDGSFHCKMSSSDGTILGEGVGLTRRVATDGAARVALAKDDIGKVMISIKGGGAAP